MAIQMRRGALANYDASKMLAGEFGVATDEDELFISFGPSDSKRVLTEDDLDSTDLTGTPTAPTAPTGTDTTQLATTAFVQQEIADHGGASTLTPVVTNGNLTFTLS